MSGVFLTCAGSHLVAGLLAHAGSASLILDNIGVPASFYFLWAVHRLHARLRARLEPPPAGRSRRSARAPFALG